jgi:hypothetical protein
MSEDDKAVVKMIIHYLDRAIDAMELLSSEGARELSIMLSENELSYTDNPQDLIAHLNELAK